MMNAHTTDNGAPRLSQPKYRADIDGLRAIAVLSVVSFHAFPDGLRGGFIGVDVFFVISGFLISTILFENLQNASFSFREFYVRRIRRIFPALLLVLTTSLALGWCVLFAEEFRQLGKHVGGGAGFVANFLLWKESGYFDNAADTKPLLHLWSLGIEEQFYMVWPVCLWLAWKRRFNPLLLTAAVAAASFVFNLVAIDNDPVGAFYSPQTRFWELLAGTALAYTALRCGTRPQANEVARASLLSGLGLVMLLAGLLMIHRERDFPGWWAMLPTGGAMLLIWAGPGAWVNRTLLCQRALVWFGLISFPLYLWHWPLLSFVRILENDAPSVGIRLAAIAAAVMLAWLTYRWVESPLRHRPGRQVVFGLLGAMTLVFLAGSITFAKNGWVERGINTPFRAVNPKTFNLSRQSDRSCAEQLGISLLPEEVCLTNSSKPKVLFVGDSHAMALYSGLYAGLVDHPALLISAHSCLPYDDIDFVPPRKSSWGNHCREVAQQAVAFAAAHHDLSTVVINHRIPDLVSGRPSNYRKDGQILDDHVAFIEGHAHLIGELLRQGKQVIYVLSVPVFEHAPTDCERRVGFIEPKRCEILRSDLETMRADYLRQVEILSQRFPLLKVFDATEVFCGDRICQEKSGADYLYQDTGHLSAQGSKQVLQRLFNRFSIPVDPSAAG